MPDYMNRVFQYHITTEDHDKTISSFLMERGYSSQNLKDLKKQPGSILLNDEWVYMNRSVQAGDELRVIVQEAGSSEHIPPVEISLDIVWEDEDILIVNKPGHMPVHPSQNHHEDTLANGVAYYYASMGQEYVFRCMNRLDRETSGLVLLAKHMVSGAMLSRMVMRHEIDKEYVAYVEGRIPQEGCIDRPIGRVPGSTIERRVDELHGERAVTHYRRLAYDPDRDYSTVLCHLETGRTHQIRVHMASIGHPLLGDGIYNPENHQTVRQALHCRRIRFRHPITGAIIDVSGEMPADLRM